jgi:hypothetical protein
MSDEKEVPHLVVPSVAANHTDPFIILHSKTISEEDINLLKEYGKVIIFEPKVYVNVNIRSLEFDYLILDLIRREDRIYYSQIDPQFLDKCNIVTICHSFEKDEEYLDEIDGDNTLTKLPEKQAFKVDFDRLLLLKKVSKPRPALSCFKSCLRMVKGDWK